MLSGNIKANRPKTINIEYDIKIFSQKSDVLETIYLLLKGEFVLIKEYYSDGLTLLNELKDYLKKKHANQSFQDQREFRDEFRRLSNLLLIEVKEYKLNVKKAPTIGWLKKLYPDLSNFHLPFPQIQGLNSAWQWYSNGVLLPVLRNKIHPYYGVYFPTRFEHLILFDNWLKRYEGPKKSAIDVGIGCGVLSFLMLKNGFQKLYGTDTNPNAIIGLHESLAGTKLSRKIEIDYGHLFGKWDKQTELIVFNPPWLPASKEMTGIDEAIYYNETLFPNFFEEAKKRLLPNGKLVIIFSNLWQITNLITVNPIEDEIQNGGRFILDKCFKKSVQAASENTKRNQHWRTEEVVELWVLLHK